MKPINERLIELREHSQLNRQHFATRIGIDQGTYSRYELGQTKPSFDTLEKIAICFPKVSATWLLTGKGQMFTDAKPDVVDSPVMQSVEESEEMKELKKDRDAWRDMAMALIKSPSAAALLGKLKGNPDAAETIAEFFRSQMRASYAA
ncbi:helix-turn-helix domain-containing protein [Hymenobacter crusticola]|nr:helix-turn-helix transcriptional regulator [Hymenobacter crusticola]